jgi:hypothetical protein
MKNRPALQKLMAKAALKPVPFFTHELEVFLGMKLESRYMRFNGASFKRKPGNVID